MDREQRLEAAQGYLMLGMLTVALDELSHLPKEDWFRPEALSLQITILMKMQSWENALKLLDPLTKLAPEVEEYHLHAAYCLHELKRTEEAKTCLLTGPETLLHNALFHYNLACYETHLGDVTTAKLCLKRCFELDKSYYPVALKDSDLTPLRDWLTSKPS